MISIVIITWILIKLSAPWWIWVLWFFAIFRGLAQRTTGD